MTDPLAPVRTSDLKYKEIVSALKLQCEDAVALDDAIVTFGNKAIGYYRQRSFLINGPQGVLHKRTVNMINYHISEVVAEAHHHQ